VKLSFDLDESLYNMISENGKKNERSVGAEIRFQLKMDYESSKND